MHGTADLHAEKRSMQIGGWEDQSDFVAMRRSSPIRGLLGLVYTFDRLVQCFEELGRLNPQGCDDFLYVDEGNVALPTRMPFEKSLLALFYLMRLKKRIREFSTSSFRF